MVLYCSRVPCARKQTGKENKYLAKILQAVIGTRLWRNIFARVLLCDGSKCILLDELSRVCGLTAQLRYV